MTRYEEEKRFNTEGAEAGAQRAQRRETQELWHPERVVTSFNQRYRVHFNF
jgi:hypothetical protein